MYHIAYSGLGGALGHLNGQGDLAGPIYSQNVIPYKTPSPAEITTQVSKSSYWGNRYLGGPVKAGIGIVGAGLSIYLGYLLYKRLYK